jgi:hypothetical protein
VATTILAVIGAVLLVLNTAVQVPRAAAAFVRALIPLVRALRTLRHEIDFKRASPSRCGRCETRQRRLRPGTRRTCKVLDQASSRDYDAGPVCVTALHPGPTH